jgi:predicted dehydrogenase
MGCTHYQVYKKHPLAKVRAVCDRSEARRQGKWQDVWGNISTGKSESEDLDGAAGYETIDELIADSNVELVDICLQTNLHFQTAKKALMAGKHVLVEKPMALNVDEAKELARLSERSGGMFMTAHCIRFWPAYSKAFELIHSGKMGEIKEGFFRRITTPPRFCSNSWSMDSKKSGGALYDLHIHDVDYVLGLMGMPEKVRAWGTSICTNGIDTVHASFDYASDCRVTIIGGWGYSSPMPFNMEFTICCEEGTLAYNMAAGEKLIVYTKNKVIEPELPEGNGYEREIGYFLECIARNKKPEIVTAQSSLDTMRVIAMEERSIETGAAVYPDKLRENQADELSSATV